MLIHKSLVGLPLYGAPRPDFYVYLVLVRHINTQTSTQYVEYYSLLTSPKATYLRSYPGGIRDRPTANICTNIVYYTWLLPSCQVKFQIVLFSAIQDY